MKGYTVQFSLNLEGARARADTGIERSARKAERLAPGWVEKAAEMLRIGACILDGQLQTNFTIEELRTLVDKAIAQPPDGRAWGAATRQAVACGFIERVPGAFRAAASSNGAPKPCYRKGLKAERTTT